MSETMRVLQVNNVAEVAKAMTDYAVSQAKNWQLYEVPAGAFGLKWVRNRLADWPKYQRTLHAFNPDIIHVHYAPNGYYYWGKKVKKVLHFHGTDARVDTQVKGKSQLIKKSCAQADLLVYATLDLEATFGELGLSGIYLPNPLPGDLQTRLNLKQNQLPVPDEKTIVINARLDRTKGAPTLIKAAQLAIARGYRVIAFAWGDCLAEAEKAGIEILPLQTPNGFQNYLDRAGLIMGQVGLPALGMADFRALLSGRPFLRGPVLDGPEGMGTAVEKDFIELLSETLKNPDCIANWENNVGWLKTHHGLAACMQQWEQAYQKYLL